MKDSRKIFFASLLVALLIISNIVAIKMTVIAKLPLSCSIFVYPFTFLCTTAIAELYGNKDARKSVLFAIIIQLIVLISYIIVVNVPNQIDTIDQANALQRTLTPIGLNDNFYPDMRPIIASIIAFTLGQLINIGLYSFARKNTYKLIAVALSVIIAMIVDTTLYVVISQINVIPNNELIIQLINRFVVDVVAAIIIIPLFMLFTIKKKSKEVPKKEEKKAIEA